MSFKSKVLMVGVSVGVSADQCLKTKEQLQGYFPNHEVVVVQGLEGVKEVSVV